MSSGTKVVNVSTSSKLSRSTSLSKGSSKAAAKSLVANSPTTTKSPNAKLSRRPSTNKQPPAKQPPAKAQQKKKASKKAETSSPKVEKKIQIVITEEKGSKEKSSKQAKPKPKKQSSPKIEAAHLLLQKREPRARRRSSSAIEVRKNTTIYAGPTFNNAPAPSAIPIPPAFSPTLVSIDLMKKEQEEEYYNLERESQDLMNQYSHHLAYPQPQHLYKSHPHHFYNQLHNHHFYPYDKDLSEIQRDLRSLLKI